MNNDSVVTTQTVRTEDEASERRRYVVGALLAFVLTTAAFGLVWLKLLSGVEALIVLGALALVQTIVHLYYFLHIDTEKSHRDDLMLISFSAVIILMMVAGTIWILYDQHTRMMV